MVDESRTLRCNFPASVGQLLAVNAVPDAFLLLDGPSGKSRLRHANCPQKEY